MIVWLNGPFGVGKTTVTRELIARWPELLTFDPDQIGILCQRHLVPEPVKDWQDLPLWRELVVAAADGLLRGYRRPLVTPTTLLREEYAEEIFGRLDALSWPVFHLLLDLPAAKLRDRITGSKLDGADQLITAEVRRWRLSHVPSYERARTSWLAGEATVLSVGDRTAADVAEEIITLVRD